MSKSIDTAIELKKSIESLRRKIEESSKEKENMKALCNGIKVKTHIIYNTKLDKEQRQVKVTTVETSEDTCISDTYIGKEIIAIGDRYNKICNQIINSGANQLYYNLNDISIQLSKIYDDIKDSSVNKIKNNIQEIISILNECKEKIKEYKK